MKSIKPGRGPSIRDAVGAVVAAAFGIFWCVMASRIGAGFMIPFGLIFIGIAVFNVIYNVYNAVSNNRLSEVDIVYEDEEEDPLNETFGDRKVRVTTTRADDEPGEGVAFCPYCGNPVEGDFEFCPKCGKKLPE